MATSVLGIIPAAGSGIRARPYTYEVHKGMFEIDGKPNIERHIDLMRDEMRIKEIVIVLGYMGESIEEYFGDGTDYGVRIQYVENQHLDKGWAWSVLLAKPFLAGRNACVMLADEFYLNSNIGDIAKFDLDKYNVVCPVKPVADPTLIKKNFSVERDGQRVIRLVENPVALPNDLLGMATFMVHASVMQELEFAFENGRTNLDFVTFADDLIRSGRSVGAFDVVGDYINLNDVACLEAAQDAAIRSRLEKGSPAGVAMPSVEHSEA